MRSGSRGSSHYPVERSRNGDGTINTISIGDEKLTRPRFNYFTEHV
jgi:hypothetical protein